MTSVKKCVRPVYFHHASHLQRSLGMKKTIAPAVIGAVVCLWALSLTGCKGPAGPQEYIVDPGVDHITITAPSKLNYHEGDSLNTAGLTVTAYYVDTSVATVTSGYVLSWNSLPISNGSIAICAAAGDKTVTVSWQGKSATFTISVFDTSGSFTVTNTAEWNAALGSISVGGDDKGYTITVSGDVAVPGSAGDSFGDTRDISVTLKGSGKLYLLSQGSILRVAGDQTLIIDSEELTLEGLTGGVNSPTNNNSSVVTVFGTLELRNGTISGNTSDSPGGGVYCSGTFTMTGGTISGNTSISGDYNGGGVYCNGTFTMDGGTISGNTGRYNGGGVYIFYGHNFALTGGTISGNTCSYSGGGVFIYFGYSFTMEGGTISGNTANAGGGVYTTYFTMTGGTISGNTSVQGGGVFIYNNGSFDKTGGIVYGNDSLNPADKNIATYGNNWGDAVYYSNSGAEFIRDTTLDNDTGLSTSVELPVNSGDTLNGWTKR